MSQIDVGDVVHASSIFENDSGTAVDPGTVRCRVLSPSGTSTTYTYLTDDELTKLSAGHYDCAIPATEAGVWWALFEGDTTDAAAEPVRFIVNSDPFNATSSFIDVAAVEAYTPGRAPFDGMTKPTRDEVQRIYEDATAEISMLVVESGYALPIPTTATVAHRIVDAACAKCAAAAVEDIAPTKDEENRKATRRMCEEAKRMIKNGLLPGVDRDDDKSSPRSGFGATAYFTRDMAL